jgi:3-hydroxybutyryl-CoA dehydrogenase
MQIKRVGVLGCGLMGSGIVEVCARAGYEVVVREVTDEFLKKGLDRLDGSMNGAVDKGKLKKEDRDAARARIRGTTRVADLGECDAIIEAIIEDRAAKKEIWQEIGKVAKKDALLATNTSSIPLSSLAPSTGNPTRFLGLHFMNPVPIMKLVEIVRGIQTSEETHSQGKAFIESLGKTTITAKDTPGFVINVLLIPFIAEAVRLVEAGVATPEDIDKGMELGCNMPMGPLKLGDFVGLDTALNVAEVLFNEFKDPKYAAPPLLRRMVESGWLGKKSGRGFYDYSKKEAKK